MSNTSKSNQEPHVSSATFHRLNTKSDPSQNGSPIPFQAGDFSSSDYENSSSKSTIEIISFYFIGISLSVLGYFLLINLSIFQGILDDTLWSFIILFTMILFSFIIAKLVLLFNKKRRRS